MTNKEEMSQKSSKVSCVKHVLVFESDIYNNLCWEHKLSQNSYNDNNNIMRKKSNELMMSHVHARMA